MAKKKSAPWKKKSPAKKHTKLTPAQKKTAKASAKAAGRRYPNLVDNMNAARKTAKKKSSRKKAAKKK